MIKHQSQYSYVGTIKSLGKQLLKEIDEPPKCGIDGYGIPKLASNVMRIANFPNITQSLIWLLQRYTSCEIWVFLFELQRT